MIHKIKGWARDFTDHGTGYELGNGGGWAEFSEDGKEEFGDVACTLVTTHERMFTESEVKAAILAAIEAMKKDLPHSPGHISRVIGSISKALLDIGIVLDPA